MSVDVADKRDLLLRLIVAEVIARPGESPLARRRLVRRASAVVPEPKPPPDGEGPV